MKPLIEALIGSHNINKADTVLTKCVYVSEETNTKNCVWIFLSKKDAQERYINNELRNSTLENLLKKNIIGIWIQPTSVFLTNPDTPRSVYVREATRDYKKDFKTLYDSRDVKPVIKEFTPNVDLSPNMKILDYYKQSNWFQNEVNKLKK